MVFLGGTPAALIGVAAMLVGWLARWHDEAHYLLNNVLTYAVFPLARWHRLPRERAGDSGSPLPTRSSTCCVFALFQFALLINFVMIAGYGCYVERVSFASKLQGAARGAALRVRQRDARRRGRLHLPHHRHRGDRPLRRRPDHLPVPARPAAALPAARRRAGEAQQAAGQLPGRDVERDAAHARPAGPDDRPALRRRRPLLAGDRPAGRLLAPGRGAGPHRGAAARHRQVHPSRPHPQGQRAAHRRGLDADQAPSPAGRPRRLLARRLRPGGGDHPRPPRADRRQGLSRAAWPATTSRSWRGSSPSPTPTT